MEQLILVVGEYFAPKWGTIVWILCLFLLSKVGLYALLWRLRRFALGNNGDVKLRERQFRTMAGIISAAGNTLIYAALAVALLNLFGVNTTALLTGAGLIGIVVGFSTQSLVKDFVAGIIILMEHQYVVGDRIKIGTSEGEVVRITSRSTVLRDDDGRIHYITNGSISNVVNFSQQPKKKT